MIPVTTAGSGYRSPQKRARRAHWTGFEGACSLVLSVATDRKYKINRRRIRKKSIYPKRRNKLFRAYALLGRRPKPSALTRCWGFAPNSPRPKGAYGAPPHAPPAASRRTRPELRSGLVGAFRLRFYKGLRPLNPVGALPQTPQGLTQPLTRGRLSLHAVPLRGDLRGTAQIEKCVYILTLIIVKSPGQT